MEKATILVNTARELTTLPDDEIEVLANYRFKKCKKTDTDEINSTVSKKETLYQKFKKDMNERLKNEVSLKGKEKQEYINMLWLFNQDNKNNLLNDYNSQINTLISEKPDIDASILQDEAMRTIYLNYKTGKKTKVSQK